MYRFSIPTLISVLLMIVSCSSQETTQPAAETPTEELGPVTTKKEPHRYGGWYCPDNFGFVPVDIAKLNEVPAIAHRLPTKTELEDHMSLINVDTEKYPDAQALDMDLPRIASIYSRQTGMSELVIVIQAIVVQGDSVVGYRFPNGGNGSAWLSDVTFLSEKEVAALGSQPFYYSKIAVKAPKEAIWDALRKTDYFKELGEKFDQREFFWSAWDPNAKAHLNLDTDTEKATGYVGMTYGNFYLQIDYLRNGFHYSEKMLLMENHENGTTDMFFACGPYTQDFEKQKLKWQRFTEAVKASSEAH